MGIFFHNVLIDSADLDLAPAIPPPPPPDVSSPMQSASYGAQASKPAADDRRWTPQQQHQQGGGQPQLRTSPTAAIAPAPRSPPAWGDSSAAADAFSTALHSVRCARDALLR